MEAHRHCMFLVWMDTWYQHGRHTNYTYLWHSERSLEWWRPMNANDLQHKDWNTSFPYYYYYWVGWEFVDIFRDVPPCEDHPSRRTTKVQDCNTTSSSSSSLRACCDWQTFNTWQGAKGKNMTLRVKIWLFTSLKPLQTVSCYLDTASSWKGQGSHSLPAVGSECDFTFKKKERSKARLTATETHFMSCWQTSWGAFSITQYLGTNRCGAHHHIKYEANLRRTV